MTPRLRALADRRADNRLPSPTCAYCGDKSPMIGIIRTTRFVYFRCDSCGDVQPKVMPALPLMHGLVARLSE
jgi:translation initiation factor 2 beta subunit (eIF-2beta)/eIF-5